MKIDRTSLAISVGCVIDASRGATMDISSTEARQRLVKWFRRWYRPTAETLEGVVKDRDRLLAALALRPTIKRGDVIVINKEDHVYVGDAGWDGTRWSCRYDRRENFREMCVEFDRLEKFHRK